MRADRDGCGLGNGVEAIYEDMRVCVAFVEVESYVDG